MKKANNTYMVLALAGFLVGLGLTMRSVENLFKATKPNPALSKEGVAGLRIRRRRRLCT